MKGYRTVDAYIEGHAEWSEELAKLRTILNSTPLEETVKWGAPCYTHEGKNVVGIGAFRQYVALWFYQGALLADEKGVLINAQEGKTKALRQWRFSSAREIPVRVVKAYVKEAMALVDSGKELRPERKRGVVLPDELASALEKDRKAQAAFDELTPGRRREYAEHVAEAKRDATKQKRVEKILPMIRAGQGLNDKYRNC